jgi:hypothetical protein
MLLMFFFILGVDQDVINEDHDKLVQLRPEYGINQVHEICMSISESKHITRYSYNPYLMEKAVLGMSFG